MKKTMDENVIDVETEPVEEEDTQEVETEPKKKKFHLTKKGAIIGGAGAAILVGAIKSIFGRSRHLEDLPDEDDQDEDEDSDDESDEDSSDE